jgi:hypothetical protein
LFDNNPAVVPEATTELTSAVTSSVVLMSVTVSVPPVVIAESVSISDSLSLEVWRTLGGRATGFKGVVEHLRHGGLRIVRP